VAFSNFSTTNFESQSQKKSSFLSIFHLQGFYDEQDSASITAVRLGELKVQCGKAAIIHTTKDITPDDKRRAQTPSTARRLKPGGATPKAGARNLIITVPNELTTATGGRVLRELRPKENLNLN
jgi:hypothetical protein